MQEVRPALAETYLSAKTLRLRRNIVSNCDEVHLRKLARQLKDICVDEWDSGPSRPRLAAKLLTELTTIFPDPRILAYSNWANGIRDLTFGLLDQAITKLDSASKLLARYDDIHESAKPQIALVTALAILGDLVRVENVGKRALMIFEDHNDLIGAGKIEINLSNLASRRGQHQKAKKLALSARSRFINAKSHSLTSVAENGLAITYTELYDFLSAEKYFDSASKLAELSGKLVTEAEIEASVGTLRLNRGDLAGSLKAFELSRRQFEALRMPHKSLVAELEIADIYSELNMRSEASEIYARVAPLFARLKMPVEEARSRMGWGTLLLRMREYRAANRQFTLALRLFLAMRNVNGQAIVILNQSWMELHRHQYEIAIKLAREASRTFSRNGNRRQLAMADWVIGESLVGKSKYAKAIRKLNEASIEARHSGNAHVEFLCSVSLGNAELSRGEVTNAVTSFRRAIEISDSVREPLTGDEFRISVSQGRHEPYLRLAKIFLEKGHTADAFELLESGRSQQLNELVNGDRSREENHDFSQQINELREILNWDYSRLRNADNSYSERLRKKIARQERSLATLLRRSQSTHIKSQTTRRRTGPGKLTHLQAKLTDSSAVLYVFKLENSYSAFLITQNAIECFADLASEQIVADLSLQLRFQMDTYRFGGSSLAKWAPQLKERTDHILSALSDIFQEPLSRIMGYEKLLIMSEGEFHYVPFCALRHRDQYLAETFAISYAPSAAVWTALQDRPKPELKNALFMGFASETVPEVEKEARELSKTFKGSKCLVGAEATLKNFLANSAGRDLIHIACHGDFRSDDPRYSSLFMADGRINVNDVSAASLSASLVTLSACETGINRVHEGNEIVGLARGFLAGGASSLVMSLWNVNDSTTREFMVKFYSSLQSGRSVAEALRLAQLQFIQENSHPYFWAPFVALG